MGSFDSFGGFFLKSLCIYFKLSEPDSKAIYSNSSVYSFVNDPDVKILFVTSSNQNQLLFWTEVPELTQQKRTVAFIKRYPEQITAENVDSLLTISVQGSASQTCYNVLDSLFAPWLLKHDGKYLSQCPRIQLALNDLIIGLSDLSKIQSVDRDKEIVNNVIIDVASEAEYWQAKAKSAQAKHNRDWKIAETIYNHLKSAADATQRLQLHSALRSHEEKNNNAFDFLEYFAETLESTVLDGLDDVWRISDRTSFTPYPESRMRSLIEAITGWICRTLMAFFGSADTKSELSLVWCKPLKQVQVQLTRAIQLCDKWEKSCIFFVYHLWARGETRQWIGEPPSFIFFEKFRNRLKKVLEIRFFYDQLLRVFNPQDRVNLGLTQDLADFLRKNFPLNATESLSGRQCSALRHFVCNPLAYNQCTAEHWSTALGLFDEATNLAEEAAVQHLRNIMSSSERNSDVSQVLSELQRFSELYKRPIVAKALYADREMFLGCIETEAKTIRETFFSAINGNDSSNIKCYGRNIPTQLDRIIWATQLESRISELLLLANSVLSDLESHARIKEKLDSLSGEVSGWRRDQFDEWCCNTQAALDRKESSSEDGGGSAAFDSAQHLLRFTPMTAAAGGGRLAVTYPAGLVRLQREVRLLAGLGYAVPQRLHTAAAQAEKLYKHAIILKQVANFYNSIESEMLPCQQALMINSAKAFEQLIGYQPGKRGKGDESLSASHEQASGGISWKQIELVPKYIAQLQEAVRHLIEENRQLRSIHNGLIAKITELMDVDMLREQSRWREELVRMRCRLAEVSSSSGYTVQNMRPWLRHLDWQLFKALEVQYHIGLETLNQRMPEMHVDMVYQRSQLAFQPPLEEIRSKYYRAIRKFIGIPLHFRGVSESQDRAADSESSRIFALIIDNSASRLQACYQKAEALFTRLEATMDVFRNWIALGNVDLEDLVDVQCRDIADFENNFRALKRRGRAAGELPSEMKVECFTVNCIPVKNAVEQLLQRLSDALLNCLRRSVQAELVTTDAFLADAIERLSVRPQTIEEMIAAREDHTILSKEQTRIVERLNCAEAKNKLLSSVASSGVGTFVKTKSKWSRYQLMMDSFKLMMDEQLEILKSNLDSRIKVCVGHLERFAARWQHARPSNDLLESGDRLQCLEALETIRSQKDEFVELEKSVQDITRDCTYFQTPLPDFTILEETRASLLETEAMWSVYEEFSLELIELEKEDWISFRTRLYVFDEFLTKWNDRLKKVPTTFVNIWLLKEIDRFKELLPALKWIKGEALSPDHWVELFHLLGLPRGWRVEEITFGTIVSAAPRVVANTAALKALNARAHSELLVRDALQELDIWAADAVFTLTPYTDSAGRQVKLIKEWMEIVTQVGDNQALLASLQGSPCFSSFSDRVSAWEKRLTDLDTNIRALQIVQRRWVYLEPIFSGGALKTELSRFNRVDADFRSLMTDIDADNRVVKLLKGRKGHELLEILTNMQDQLTRCQRALNEYLEEKRVRFPRFYFLGDDDLLEMLGQFSNPLVIQTHLRKLFQAIYGVRMVTKEDRMHVTDLYSAEGEVVPLTTPVVIEGNETWLQILEAEMYSTLSNMLTECLMGHSDTSVYPGQILALKEMIGFSEKVERCIKTGKLSSLLRELKASLKSYSEANMRCQAAKANGDFEENPQATSKASSAKLGTLILDTVHAIDVVDHLIKRTITSVYDWNWQKQLRFYASSKPEVTAAPTICMANAEFTYTFEYQGNGSRLVHTPLTDKCYLCLTQAMQMGLGGNPYGPAGTGKTESVKQLGELFGRLVLVFNCDEGIDVESMGRIFVGIVRCGAWGCFDEFNRLEEAVLSAVSMQIQIIQNALRSGSSSVDLFDTPVSLNPAASMFITMNPAGRGYGGRQKLPDNLKQLFRPVAMSKPDNDLIAETLLFSQGFTHGCELGRKLVAIFNLSSQILSVQQHYDWGLRALKTVLKHAGMLLQESKQEETSDAKDALMFESQLIIQAVRTCSLAKLTYADATRFQSLLLDVFPSSVCHGETQESDLTKKLTQAIHEALNENHLEVIQRQILKVLELYSLLTQRMGVVVVGPSGCGKSVILQVLWLALQKIGVKVNRHVMNPKAMPRTQLLGRIDTDTREWFDGVLIRTARDVVRESPESPSWIICDGDVDPEWVESLNSVLDDNQLLTLPSGERIRFGGNVNFIFETHDLSCASPATVSRSGVVFISDEMLCADAIIRSWLKKQPDVQQQFLSDMIDLGFRQCLAWVTERGEYLVETSLTGTILNGLSHLTDAKNRARFTVGLIRGLGANLPDHLKSQFAMKVFEIMGENPPDPTQPLNVRVDKASGSRLIPYPDDVCLINESSVGSFEGDIMDVTSADLANDKSDDCDTAGMKAPLVMTAHMRLAIDSFRMWLEPEMQNSFLLVGPEGCGKSLLLEYCLSACKRKTEVVVVQCAAQTRASHILGRLCQSCAIVTGNSIAGSSRVIRPKKSDRLVLFLRDLNLPKPDKWGSCEVGAFLQQILTYKGYYDASTLEFIGIEGIQIIATLTPSSSRYRLSPRLTSLLRIACMSSPDREELHRMCFCLLQRTIDLAQPKPNTENNNRRLNAIASTMVHVWSQMEQEFKTSGYPHCNFSLRDLTRWVSGMKRYDLTPPAISGNLWFPFSYEARRLFRDRMPGDEFRQKFDKLFSGLLHINADNSADLDDWSTLSSKTLAEFAQSVRFAIGDPRTVRIDGGKKATESSFKNGQHWFISLHASYSSQFKSNTLYLASYSEMHELVSSALKQLESESSLKASELVIFPDFLDLVARIDRVISKPYGNLLLAGRCGIGRRSALRVTIQLHQISLVTLHLGSSFTKRSFYNDLKAVVQVAGVDGLPAVLLLEDYQLVDECILETMNSLMSCGDAPGLLSNEEIESLVSKEGVSLREIASEAGHTGTLASFFAKRVHANLHVVIILETDCKDTLINRLQANPSLCKYCEVTWFDNWSTESQLILPSLLVPCRPEKVEREVFSRSCLAIHNSVPYSKIASPRRFLLLCNAYKSLYGCSRKRLEYKITRIKAGLTKLNEARELVNQLKTNAALQEKKLREKQTEADKALAGISTAMQSVGEQRVEMQELQRQAAKEAADLEARRAAIEAEVAVIGPQVEATRVAVGAIRTEALAEVRALRAPPAVIRDILEGVLLLMGLRDTSWAGMRAFLARRGVQEEIRAFDAHSITPDMRHSVEELLKRCESSFTPKIARRASVAAVPLAAWVEANVAYARVLEHVEPLERERVSLEASLEKTNSEVRRLSSQLASVDARVAELRAVFESHAKAAAELQLELTKANNTLAVAEKLVTELENEYRRWNTEVETLSGELETLPVSSLLAAGLITYLSACPEDVRQRTLGLWWHQLEELDLQMPANIRYSKESQFDFIHFLATEKELLHWKSQGLPSDSLSVENAIVILQSTLFPLIVGPSERVVRWLRCQFTDQQIEVTDQRNSNFVSTLELAVRFGKVLIIQDVDRIKPILFPLLRREFTLQGSREAVRLGEKEVDYNENFRLFLTSRKVSGPVGSVEPECASSLVTVVNFQTTRAGLVGRLLEVTLNHERADLETRRLELLKSEETKRLELAQLEDKLLEDLANARGNILENSELLDSLNKTKHSSINVAHSLAELERLQSDLENERKEFKFLAEGGSQVFFALNDLMKINGMYQFSLSSFLATFRRALETPCDASLSVEKKLKYLLGRLEALVVELVLRALFKADRLTFLLHLTRNLRPNKATDEEWEVLLKDVPTESESKKGNLPSWIPSDRLAAMSKFKTHRPALYERLRFNQAEIWSLWMNSEEAESGKLPAALSDVPVTDFQVMLVIQALQPVALYHTMIQFAKNALGLPQISSSNVSLLRLFNSETSPTEPILLITSPGTDPSQELADAAAVALADDDSTDRLTYHEVAMGQGQSEVALTHVTMAARTGGWVCLKNLHLVTQWLPVLEKLINSVVAVEAETEQQSGEERHVPHPAFRLWLTTEPYENFPSALLQSCLKVAYETPPGLRNNLKRTYENWSVEFFSKGDSLTRSTALTCLAWFHAVLHERRSFIPRSWTKFYEFTHVDIRAATSVLDRLFTPSTYATNTSTVWQTLRGLLGDAIYGGRMDNEFDFRVLQSFLNKIFSDSTVNERRLGSLKLPNTTNLKDYVAVIDQLPDNDEPRDLELPENIGKIAQSTAASSVLVQLRTLRRATDTSDPSDHHVWAIELTPILNLWKSLNHDLGLLPNKDKKIRDLLARVEEKSLRNSKESPILSFLHRETTRALKLIATMHSNLGAVAKFLRGNQMLSREINTVVRSILRGETPSSWLLMWTTGSEECFTFIHSTVLKMQALQKWLQRAVSMPQFFTSESSFNLADLFHPTIFIGAFKQQTARQLGLPIDQLKLVSKWPSINQDSNSYMETVFITITGLVLESALFGDDGLIECYASSPTASELPEVKIAWIPMDVNDCLMPYETVELPVYFDATRSCLLLRLQVPCSRGSQEKWALNGTAIVLKSV